MGVERFRKMFKINGFTLVELIVVISVLAILSTIGFIQIKGFSSSARDSDRITTLKNIDSGLSLFQLQAGSYPMPEAGSLGVVLTGSINGTVYSYMGVIGNNNTSIIRMNKTPMDPLSNTNYIYGVSRDMKYYQTATVLENTVAYNVSPSSFTQNISPFFSLREDTSRSTYLLGGEGDNDFSIIPTTYADSASYQAKVNGVYPGYFKFSSGSEVWIANVPSLLWNNTGSINLLSSGTYFVVNKQANLPYKLDTTSVIQNKDGNQMVQAITGTGVASLTGVNISSVTTATGVSSLFTGSLLASFGGNIADVQVVVFGGGASSVTVVPNDCTLSGVTVPHGTYVTAFSETAIDKSAEYDCINRQQTRTCNNGVLDGSGTYQYAVCEKGTINNCSASGSYAYNGHGYSIPALNHASGTTNILSANVSESNGIFKYTLASVSCNDGVLGSANENGTPTVQSCNGGYHIESNACMSDTKSVACGGTNPGATASTIGTTTVNISWNGSAWNATPSWGHIATAPGVCQYQCKAGYWYDGSTCTQASAGNYVASAGSASQSPCGSADKYQGGVGQISCSTATSGYYTTGGTSTTRTGQIQCEVNNWCSGGVKTACGGGLVSPVGSVDISACVAVVNGVCGASNGTNLYTTPSVNLCSTGTPTLISGNGPWTWGCNGANGGSNTISNACSANKKIDGVCNNSTKYACSTGTSVSNNAGICGGNSTWTCNGVNSGTNASCSMPNAICPAATCNNSYALGCTTGSSQSDNGQVACNTTRTWYCAGAGYSISSQCSRYNGGCVVYGTYVYSSTTYKASGYCTNSAVGDGSWQGSCYGSCIVGSTCQLTMRGYEFGTNGCTENPYSIYQYTDIKYYYCQ